MESQNKTAPDAAIDPPRARGSVNTLWKTVFHLVRTVNALVNMEVTGGGKFYRSEAGFKLQAGSGSGKEGEKLLWNVAVNGQPAYAYFASSQPTPTLPDGATPMNPV